MTSGPDRTSIAALAVLCWAVGILGLVGWIVWLTQ